MSRAWLPHDCPDRSRLVGLPWGRVFVTDVGDGPGRPLVLLHDVLVTSWSFHRIVPGLATTRRVIAIDLPGTGESDRPAPEPAHGYALSWLAAAVADTLAALELHEVDVLGQGLGGSVGLWFASEHPAGIGRVVVAAPYLWQPSLPAEQRLARVPAVGHRLFDTVYRRADLRRTLASWHSAPELVDPVALDVAWDRLERWGGVPAVCAIIRQLDGLESLRERLPTVVAPTLVLWGDRDRVVVPAQAIHVAELMPDARPLVIDGCGHAIAEDRPERMVQAVLAHLGPEPPAEERG
jgi:pimeloyl-ACP methyl ester carboxylesterase